VTNTSGGVLCELNARTGAIRHKIRVGSQLAHFASPTLAGRVILVGTRHSVVAVTGA
jgi:hypothetical protein